MDRTTHRNLDEDYADLYARQSLRQAAVTHGGGTCSPDLLPWGEHPNPDPAGLGSTTAWAQDPGVGLVVDVDNVVYTRVRNAAAQETRGRLYLGAAAPAYLCWPHTLARLKSRSGKDWIDVKVASGDVGVALDGFVCHPGSAADSLAAWTYTLAHPVVLPAPDDVYALLAFLRDTPSYVQRSVAYGMEAGSYRFLAPYTHGTAAAPMAFELVWTDCPVTWTLALQARGGDGGVNIDPFQLGMASGSRLVQRNLAAGFHSDLEFSIDTGGAPPQAGARVEVRVSLQVDALPAAPDALRFFQLGGHLWCAQPGTS